MSGENASAIVVSPPKPGKKYFTLDEAERALPYVRRVADDIADRYERAVNVRQRIEQTDMEDPLEELRDEYEKLMDQLNGLIDELGLVGVELKDFERGLIDFPSLHEGREVYLCWQRGEDTIQAWHEVDAGFAGRQEIATLVETDE